MAEPPAGTRPGAPGEAAAMPEAEASALVWNVVARVDHGDHRGAAAMLRALGAGVEEHADGLDVFGGGIRSGGRVDSDGDHRMAMAAAVAGAVAPEPVEIGGANAVGISYPAFWRDLDAVRRAGP